MSTLTPMGQRIIVKVDDTEETSPSGLVIPDSAKKQPTEGTVVGIGADITELSIGDTVIFPAHTGSPIPDYDGLRLIDITQIFAKKN